MTSLSEPTEQRPAWPSPSARRRPLVLLVLAVGVLLLGACGSESNGASSGGELEGLVRDDPLDVSAATLPEIQPDGSTEDFRFVASPENLLFVAFGYTNCPDVCPTTLSDIKKAKAALTPEQSDRVEVAFATVDPDRDTPDLLPGYLGSFVTGGHALRPSSVEDLEAAEEPFGVTSEVATDADGRVEVAHSARSFVVDDQGDVVVEWTFGVSYEAMASDLQILLDRSV